MDHPLRPKVESLHLLRPGMYSYQDTLNNILHTLKTCFVFVFLCQFTVKVWADQLHILSVSITASISTWCWLVLAIVYFLTVHCCTASNHRLQWTHCNQKMLGWFDVDLKNGGGDGGEKDGEKEKNEKATTETSPFCSPVLLHHQEKCSVWWE